jgi:hypothetical protein
MSDRASSFATYKSCFLYFYQKCQFKSYLLQLLGENKKVRQFVFEKLRQIHQQPSCLASVAPQSSIFSSSAISSKEIQALAHPSPISMASLYNAIMQVHFHEGNGNFIRQAAILDTIYKIKSNLSIEEKVPYIFQKLFTLAASLSPTDFEGNAKESKAFVCHEHIIDVRNYTKDEENGSSKSLCRKRFQSTLSCFGQKPR